MSFIEGIGDDLLYAFGFLVLIGIICLAWLSTHVNNIHLPTTLLVIERRTRRRNEDELDRATSSDHPPSSANETLTEHESDIEYVSKNSIKTMSNLNFIYLFFL